MKWISVKDRLPTPNYRTILKEKGGRKNVSTYRKGNPQSEKYWVETVELWLDESTEGEDAPGEQDELWDEVESIFDKHTSPTGGGYEADYTDRQSFLKELKQSFTITRKP